MSEITYDERDGWVEANNTYLAASLQWLRLRLRQLADTPPVSITHAEPHGFQRWLGRAPVAAPVPALAAPAPLAEQVAQAQKARHRAAQMDPAPALLALAERLDLSLFEADVLLMCAAMELDPSLPSLIATVQGGGAGYPTFSLALRLFDDPSWDAVAPQRPLRYLQLVQINQAGATPLTAAPLRADERVVNAIKGINLIDERLSMLLRRCDAAPLSATQLNCVEQILATLHATPQSSALPVVQLLGPDAGSREAVASQVAQRVGRHLHRLAAESLPLARGEIELLARLWQRESRLLPVAMYLEADALDGAGHEIAAATRQFLSHPMGLTFVGLRESALAIDPPQWHIHAPLPTAAEQHDAWLVELPGDLDTADRERQAAELSGHFQLNLGQIGAAATSARRHQTAAWNACRDLSLARLDTLAQRLTPKARWEDLVLGDEATGLLRQIAAQVRERHQVYQQWGYAERMNRGLGINALFAGESGTGKTMAAEVIANDLQLHLFRIDLSSVVSKYIGETEKNLRKLFDAAEQGGAILFFDEADALFGKRSEVKDSHDRYANIEINYLLQRMEAFSGLAILATNMKGSLDSAFMRRLRFVVNFQFPGPLERKRIWSGALPPGVPCECLDYDRLARFSLSGGNIHSIALNAAFAAAGNGTAVSMPLLLHTVRGELRKLERPFNEGEFR